MRPETGVSGFLGILSDDGLTAGKPAPRSNCVCRSRGDCPEITEVSEICVRAAGQLQVDSQMATLLLKILIGFAGKGPDAVFHGVCGMGRRNEYVKVAEAEQIVSVAQGTVRS
jgi:hypothetical protein